MTGQSVGGAVIICGGDETPGPRGIKCPNALHDHPLPSNYVTASEVAARRLYQRWTNPRCPDCGLYGWREPTYTKGVKR
jgi:hypothetical protein